MPSHYLNQCWPISVMLRFTTRLSWVSQWQHPCRADEFIVLCHNLGAITELAIMCSEENAMEHLHYEIISLSWHFIISIGFIIVGCHQPPWVLSSFHASVRLPAWPAVLLSVHPKQWRWRALSISSINLKFSRVMHSTMKQIAIWNGYAWLNFACYTEPRYSFVFH